MIHIISANKAVRQEILLTALFFGTYRIKINFRTIHRIFDVFLVQ